MPLVLPDRIKQSVASGGTGPVVLGPAISGYLSLGAAHNGQEIPYVFEEGTAWETGRGTYTHANTTVSRDTRTASSTGAAVNFTTAAVFFVGLNSNVCAPLTTTSGTNTGDETAARIGTLTAGATAKTTPVDADTFGLADSAATNILKSLTWANLKTAIQNFLTTANKLLPTLTAGSIPFSNGTTLTQDNARLFWDNTNKRLGIGTTTPGQQLEVAGFNTTNSNIKTGSLEIQPFSINNGFIAENCYYNGGWLYRATGNAGLFYFNTGEGQFRFFASGTGGTALPNAGARTQFKVNQDGTVAIGGFVNEAPGVYTGANFLINSSGMVGVGTISPSARIHSISTTEQLRLGYDASNYLSVTVSATGNVTLTAAGTGAAVTFGSRVVFTPATSATPASNGQMVVEKTSDTILTIRVRGSDGVVRSTTLTLA